MRKVMLLVAWLCMMYAGFAQTARTVTGKVTDDTGQPLSGVTVSAIGLDRNVITDEKGVFTIQVNEKVRQLKFSYVGYADLEARIVGNNVNVSMTSDAKALSEVVVVGYGTQQKKAFTGSASKIETKEFAQLVTPSVDRQLAGRAPGVQVSTPGGLVNTPARIRVRGVNSISGGLAPLIVVDGVPAISGNLAASTNSNALGDINPNDIENIEVLKDGAATAIFGSRAANGVIMITTKKGSKTGGVKINYDATFGFSGTLKRFDLLNASEFVAIANEKLANAGVLPRAFPAADGTNTDWQSQVFNQNAGAITHNLSVSGGTNKSTYFFSLNYTDQKGVIVSNWNKTYRLRFNLETEVNKFVKVGNNLTLSKQEDQDQNNGANSLGGAIAATLRLPPNVSPFNTNHPTGYNILSPAQNSLGFGPNTVGVDDNFYNTAYTLRANSQYSDKYRVINNSFVELSPMKGMKIRSTFTFDVLNDYSFTRNVPMHGDGFGSNGVISNTSQTFQRWVLQNYVNYNKSFGNHNLYLTAGHEVQQDQSRSITGQGTNISDVFFMRENLISGSAQVQSVFGGFGRSGFYSLFGRINYDFGSKYFLQASVRRDGQSSLAPENRFGVFPGFSAGWRISQENFWMKRKFLSKWFSDVKLKTSYAIVGNNLGGFPFLSTFGAANYGNISGLAASAIGNRALQWERSKKYDIGAEISLLNGRFNLGVDWFLNDIDQLVLAVPTPNSAGVPGNSISQNIGTQRNRGLELSFGGDLVRKRDFNWNFNVNFTQIQNEITSLYTIGGAPVTFIPNGNYNLIRVGDPINILYGLRSAGVNSANGNPMYFNAANQLIQHNIANGAYYFANGKNDPTLGAQTSLTFNDRANLGLAIPTWFGGINNSFRYKNFGVEVMFRYSGGNKIMNITRQEALMNQSFQNNGREILNRWTTPGQVTDVPRLVWGQGNNINQNNLAVSRFVESGDFLRLQNLVFSYNFDSKKLSDASNGYVKSLRFFFQGQNLFVWTKYTGADPENASEAGLDGGVSPQIRVFSGGLNIGF